MQAQARPELLQQIMPRRRWLALATTLVLVGLLAAGAAFRLCNINWDRYQHVHPDERFVIWVADTIRWPADASAILDPRISPLNPFRWPPGAGDLAGKPRDYAYGHFPLYLLVLAGQGVQGVARFLAAAGLGLPETWQHLGEYQYLSLVGRAISALFDLGTTIIVFALARRLYGARSEATSAESLPLEAGTPGEGGAPRAKAASFWLHSGTMAGLLAAGAYAFAVLPIQLSHFYAVDLVLTFCVVATVALAARAAEQGGRWTWLGAGAMAGLAAGSKFSAIILAAPLIVAALYRLPPAGAHPGGIAVPVRRLALVAIGALFTFALTNPFALLEPRAYLRNLLVQNAMVTGVLDAPYMRQYAGTLPFWYFIRQLSQWGLGWPLGMAAWAGFIWQVVQAARRRATPGQVVAVAWSLTYFAFTGALYAKFLRYTAPLLPFLLVFAAGAALSLGRWLGVRWGRRGTVGWAAAVALVGLFTLGWALVFGGVYRQEHPWLQASRWIETHIPAGSKLLTEHWDDALPLAMDEIPGSPPHRDYVQAELPLYEPDNQEKLDLLARELSSSDYVILASNRLAGPIQRLPIRYPLSSQYYRLLFDGALGYTPAAEFTGYPHLGGLVVPDDHADESFSVYDHPHVRIFANTGRLSASQLRSRLARYLPLPNTVLPQLPAVQSGPPGRPPGHAMMLPPGGPPAPVPPLTLSQPVDRLPVVADFRWNLPATRSPPLGVLLWWIVLGLFGWAAWPLLFPLMGGLRDRGYGIARLAGWVLVGWVAWIGTSLGLWQNRVSVIAPLLAVLVLAGAGAWYLQRRAIGVFLARRRRLILTVEAVFAAAFLVSVCFRLLDPDLWQPWNGGEKFMEFAFLNAILRSPHFPPYDPYFAGGYINYYYYGLYLVSLPIKLTGIAPEVAFNLAVPGLFALTATALFAVGASLAGRARAAVGTGMLAILLALLLGNLSSFQQVLSRLEQLGGQGTGTSPFSALLYTGRGLGALLRGASWPGFDYWAASRVIPLSINEFPFWSFLFADLHPHLIAMPVGVAVAGLALNWLLVNGRPVHAKQQQPGERDVEAGSRADTGQTARVGGNALAVTEQAVPLAAPGSRDLASEAGGMAVDHGAPQVPDFAGTNAQQRSDIETPDVRYEPAIPAAGSPDDGERVVTDGHAGAPAEALVPADDLFSMPESAALAARRAPRALQVARVLLLAIMLGALGPTNTWDLPVYFLLLAGAFWLAEWRARRPFSALRAFGLAAITGGLAVTAYLPFYTHYEALVGGSAGSLLGRYLGLVHAASPIQPWLLVWAFFLFLAYSFIMLWLFRRPGAPDRAIILLLLAVGAAAVLVMLGRPTAAVAALPLVLAFGLLFRRSLPARAGMVVLLFGLGLGILAGTELIYLRDFLEGGDWYRMNTLFKFGIPAWILLGLAGAAALPAIWRGLRDGQAVAAAWPVAAIGLLVAGLVFLPLGVQARVEDRFPGNRPPVGTLDGTAYMTVGRYSWPDETHTIYLADDYQAVHWLLNNVTGTPVVAEAPTGEYQVDGNPVGYDYYRAGGLRVASLTGFPTLVGQHQTEQRPADQVGERTAVAQEFFETVDAGRAREIMQDLHVDYIYVGPLERLLFSSRSLAKFDQMASQGELEVVYRNPGVIIYRVVVRPF